MTIYQVIILVSAAFLLGLIRSQRLWKSLLIFSSIIVYYWLQPSSSIRYLDFWLPTIAIILAWMAYTGMASLTIPTLRRNLAELGFVLLPTLVVSLNRYLSLCCVTPTLPPSIERVLMIIFALVIIILLIFRGLPEQFRFPFSFLIPSLLFIVLKNPYLSLTLSRLWHGLNHQPIQYSLSTDIEWLGISYIILRIIHVIIDVREKRQPLPDFQDFLLYLIFFPALAAGPIDLLPHFQKEVRSPIQSSSRRLEGLRRIIIGAFKKFVLADSLALLALSQQNATQIISPIYLWLAVFFYSLRIYFDFSGYTDIAIGSGLCIGIRLPENFSAPYLKTNLIQFWNSWHITLANWFRAYFFYPFVRKFQRNRNLPAWALILSAQVLTMLLIGLWHGISLNYLLWGLWHGVGLFINNQWTKWTSNHSLPILNNRLTFLVSWGLTFTFVSMGWVWFILADINTAWIVFKHLFGVGL